jgi:hypothetical protein
MPGFLPEVSGRLLMCRKGLAKHANMLKRYFAEVSVVSRFERKFGDPIPAICFKNVRLDKANTVTDHAWINPASMHMEEPFPASLEEGATVSFNATVARYNKGPRKAKEDYGLFAVRDVTIICESET